MKRKFLKKLIELRRKYNIDKQYISFEKEMVLRAVFIGLFIAFIPMPMQMFAVFLVSPFIKFNVLLAFAMCWITNPFTMPFIYFIEYQTGVYILGIEATKTFSIDNLSKVIIPLYYGAFVFSITISTLGYFLTNLIYSRKKQ